MRLLLRIFAVSLGCSVLCAQADAALKDLPVKVVGGKEYYVYEVQKKETVYSLCHRLGITKEELVKSNPAVADGLKAGQTLFFPMAESSGTKTARPEASTTIKHKVVRGETIFGIAKSYGITTERLIDLNPVVRDGLKAGQVLTITVPGVAAAEAHDESADVKVADVPEPTPQGYIVKKKETFYSIAHAHGISVAELEAANPGTTSLREGQVLSIPVHGARPQETKHAPTPVATVSVDLLAPSTTDTIAPQQGSLIAEEVRADTVAAAPERKELSVALILPFMLEEETPSKVSQRYTEFYKGFLLAVDSVRNNGVPIRISAFDSEGTLDGVRAALADKEMEGHKVVIAPDNSDQLALVAEWAKANGAMAYNAFAVRDDSYLSNPAVMQANIPSATMFTKAVDAMAARSAYSVPVFLDLQGGAGDKREFTDSLKARYKAIGKDWKEIHFEGRLTVDHLKELPADGNYSFIPTSARQSDLNKMLPAIIEWRDAEVMPMVKVLGYPEWITFRGETLSNMHNLGTMVYTRFYADDDNPRPRHIEDKFRQWYGAKMEQAVPRQGLLGFDTGMFLMKWMKNPSTRYDGVQNGFSFIMAGEGQGKVNDALYLINFRPGGIIEKINL